MKNKDRIGSEKLDGLIDEIMEELGPLEYSDRYVRRAINYAIKMKSDVRSSLDRKIVANMLGELVHSFKVFEPYELSKKITIFGSARCGPDTEEYKMALDFSAKMVKAGYMVMTGAGGGIMAAGHEGAGRENSFGLNIRLPFEAQSNPFIDGDPKNMMFRYFFTRKLMMVKETDAIAFFPGGFGTLDECMETITLAQTGKAEPIPMVMLDAPGRPFWKNFITFVNENLISTKYISPEDLNLFHFTEDIDDACNYILKFYRNYHSTRFVGGKMVIRLSVSPTAQQVEKLNREFGDIVKEGEIELTGPTQEEIADNDLVELPRISLVFNGKRVGRLRLFIGALNDLEREGINSPVVVRSKHSSL